MAAAHDSELSCAPSAVRWGSGVSIDPTAGQEPRASMGPRDCVSILRHRAAAEGLRTGHEAQIGFGGEADGPNGGYLACLAQSWREGSGVHDEGHREGGPLRRVTDAARVPDSRLCHLPACEQWLTICLHPPSRCWNTSVQITVLE